MLEYHIIPEKMKIKNETYILNGLVNFTRGHVTAFYGQPTNTWTKYNDFNVVIAPGLMYNLQQYSGMMCQFVCEFKKKLKHGSMDVLAAGGRYDDMIANYKGIKEHANMLNKDVPQSAVGISISLDKLVQALQEEGVPEIRLNNLDVVVCSVGTKTLIKEKSKILKDLWTVGVRCGLIEASNLEEIQEQCVEFNIPHVIMLKESGKGAIKICSRDKDRFQEKTVNTQDLIETIQKLIKVSNDGYQPIVNSRSDNKTLSCYEHSHEADISILLITMEKLTLNTRRRYENQIKSQLDKILKRLSGVVIIFGLNLEASIIRTITAFLDFDSEHSFQKSFELICERYQRHKEYLTEICDEIYNIKLKHTNAILILYSICDSFHNIISINL